MLQYLVLFFIFPRHHLFHINSSWSSSDRLRALRLSSRLWGKGGVLPLRNKTARALIFWHRSNTCSSKLIETIRGKYLNRQFQSSAPELTDEASISATPSQPLPPPCSKSQYRTASFSSSNTCTMHRALNEKTKEEAQSPWKIEPQNSKPAVELSYQKVEYELKDEIFCWGWMTGSRSGWLLITVLTLKFQPVYNYTSLLW